ncbi:HNH/ENDO VII family nuclease [Anoxybacillus sp. D401a]|uniref:HNH/ENDO VII family nuclease n=1 Tax=Anoxybacillus sp. D401a TaxID=575112 RepID=UPI003D32B47A
MPISKSISAVMTRSSYSSTVNTHVTNTAPKIEKVNHPQNSSAKSSQTSISKDTVHISQGARKAYESSTSIAAINPVRNTIGNTVYKPIDFIKREASRNLGNQTETALYNPVKSIKDALQAAFKLSEKDTVQMRKEVQEASQQAQKSNDVKKVKEEALIRQIQLSFYSMGEDVRAVIGHNMSQNIYTVSKNKSDKGWSATKELIDALTDVVPGIGTIKDAYRLYQVLNNPKSDAKDVAEALIGFIPGLGDLKSIAKVTNAIKKAFDVDPKKLDQAVSIIKGTGNGYKYWNKTTVYKNVKVYQRNDIIDPYMKDARGRTNLERMEKGLAPLGSDGKPINLHHMTQRNESSIAEVTQTFHKENSKIIHINPNTIPSGINRNEFDKWRKDYWKDRVSDFK